MLMRFIKFVLKDFIGVVNHYHDWEYQGVWGITYQLKICKICGKHKIVDR